MDSTTKKSVVTPLLLDNYLHMVKASVNSTIFRNFYCTVDGKKMDILHEGDLSCAFFASWILMPFHLLKDAHATVSGTVKDLKESGWITMAEPQPGAVIVWAPQKIKTESHAHIGFFIGEGLTISNDSQKRSPQIHPWNTRPIEDILWHPKLDGKKE